MIGSGESRVAKLNELCDINPSKPRLDGVPDETEVMFLPMAAVDDLTGMVTEPKVSTIGEVARKSYRGFTSGDVLFAKITPSMENGKAAIVPHIPSGFGFGSTEFHVLRPKSGVDARLIWHYLRQPSFRDEAARHFTGSVGQLRVPADFLRESEMLLPRDDSAQRALADLLDAVTNHANSAGRHLVTARSAVRKLRQAFLAAACSGRLTVDWRDENPAVVPAESFVTTLDGFRKERSGRRHNPAVLLDTSNDLPSGWAMTTIGSLVDVATGATPLRRRADYWGGSIPWVTSGAVNAGFIEEPSELITDAALNETSAKLFPAGTLLVAMYGEGQTRGRVAELGIESATNQAVAALLFTEESEVLRPYLRLFFEENYQRIRRQAFGGVQPNLSLGVIRGTPVVLPPVDEQREIVSRAGSLLEKADRILARISAAEKELSRGRIAAVSNAFQVRPQGRHA